MSEENQITYELLPEKALEQTINCLADVFTSTEPVFTALKITPSEFYPFAEIICQKAVEDGLSLVAKDSVTSQVAGVIISEDLSTELSAQSYTNLPQKFEICYQYLKELHERYENQKKAFIGKVFPVFMLAAKEQYRNKKIGKNLLEKSNCSPQQKSIIEKHYKQHQLIQQKALHHCGMIYN